MSTAVKITHVEDIRPGDYVTLYRNGTTVSGTVRDVTHGDYTHLDIATLPCVLIVGDGYWTFVRATREVPDAPPLPTKEGSVIVASGDDHGHKFADVPLILFRDNQWVGVGPTGNPISIPASAVTYWEPARIVPESGVEVKS